MSQEKIDDRQDKLKAMIDEANCTLSSTERDSLFALLSEYHDVFSLDDNERGEIDLVQLTRYRRSTTSETVCKTYTICSPRGVSPSVRDHAEFWSHKTI